MMLPLVIPAGRLSEAVRHALKHSAGWVGFFLTRSALDNGANFHVEDLHRMGCAARIIKHQEVDGGALQVFAQVVTRYRFESVVSSDPVVLVRGEQVRSQVDPADANVRAMAMAIVTALKDLVQHNPVFSDEIKMVLSNFNNIDGPGRLADIAASLTTAKREEIQQILETVPIVTRMERVLVLLAREVQLSQLKSKIQHQIEEKVTEENQRKFFLTEQLKAIKQELRARDRREGARPQALPRGAGEEGPGDERGGAAPSSRRSCASSRPSIPTPPSTGWCAAVSSG